VHQYTVLIFAIKARSSYVWLAIHHQNLLIELRSNALSHYCPDSPAPTTMYLNIYSFTSKNLKNTPLLKQSPKWDLEAY